MFVRTLGVAAALAMVAPLATANVLHDDAVDGNLSNDPMNPDVFHLGLGMNSIISETVLSNLPPPDGDRDFFTVVVGAGMSISQIILAESSLPNGGFDDIAFVAMQFGPLITVDPDMPDASLLAGWILTTSDLVGTDVLSLLSGGMSSLGPGEYAFWVQQTGDDLTRVRLDFMVVPAPGALALLGLGGLAGVRRRR